MGRRFDRTDAMMAALVLVWGTAFPAIKVLGGKLDPYEMTWFRYAPFPLLYGAYVLAKRRHVFRTVRGDDWIRFTLLGAVGVVGYHFPLNWGLQDTAAGPGVSGAVGAILVATVPLFTLLLAVGSRQERFGPLAFFGSVLAFAGVAVVVAYGRGAAELAWAKKAAIILLAPLSWAVYTVAMKPLVARYGGLFATGVSLSLGTFMLVPMGLSFGVEPLRGFEPIHWFWLLFLAVLSTALGYAVWNQALKHRKPSDVAVYVYFQPVVATLVGALYLRETVTLWFLLGGALVLAGVVLVNKARLAAPVPRAARATAE
ncbi:MAG TPA: DMT family transporter [Candidatus Thermoplasmatota archaeon]|nr:DMT family transporter [Candidatus Thermoplasmatota archaeon]